MILSEAAPVGTPLRDYLGDEVLTVELTPDMARWFVSYAYPGGDDPAVITKTSELIDGSDLPPGLVRLLVEGRDGLRRALRCQEHDRQSEALGR